MQLHVWHWLKRRCCLARWGSAGIQGPGPPGPQETVVTRVLTLSTLGIWGQVIFCHELSCAL